MFFRQTFIALRARRSAWQIATEIQRPPMDPPPIRVAPPAKERSPTGAVVVDVEALRAESERRPPRESTVSPRMEAVFIFILVAAALLVMLFGYMLYR